jgi:transposase
MSKAELSREGQEWRRLRAWDLWQQGWKQTDIATALGVTKGAVSQWIKRGREEGAEGLRRSMAKGAKPRISVEQRAPLPTFLALGAEAFGSRGNVWTGQQRLAELIKRVFGISYHQDHCSRILRRIGWSVQKPTERATQRDEETIKYWKEQ